MIDRISNVPYFKEISKNDTIDYIKVSISSSPAKSPDPIIIIIVIN